MMPKGSQFLLENGALDLFFVEKNSHLDCWRGSITFFVNNMKDSVNFMLPDDEI